MKGATRSPTPVHIRKPDQPSHCIRVRWPASNGSMSPTPMVSALLPIVNETICPSSTSVPLLVSHERPRDCIFITDMENLSRSAPPIRAAATDEAHDKHQYHRAGKSHDDLTDDRVADHHEVDMQETGEEAPQKRSQDAHDDVAKDAE